MTENNVQDTVNNEENADLISSDLDEALSSDYDESRFSSKDYRSQAIKQFSDSKLNPKIIEVLDGMGWKTPTEVQGLCLPHSLKGHDVAGFAQTGTGKTGVFLITAADKLLKLVEEGKNKGVQCIILAPTRELAMQIDEECKLIIKPLGLKSLAVYGGVDYERQAKELQKGVDLIVATPGRLKDYAQKKIVNLKDTSLFICDEVDRMFEMGFIEDVEYFLSKVNENSQKLFFSATTNDNVKELSFEYLNRPHYITVTPDSVTSENIDQSAVLCETRQKLRVFMGLLRDHNPERGIIFTNTKLTAAWLQYKLKGNGFNVDCITGDLPQRKRISLVKRIKKGDIKLLIATDVASRGLHISNVTHVYNFDLPADAANYVHRIGRTARAGAKGVAVSLVCEEYATNLLAINELLGDEAPTCVWFPNNYLDTADRAGDPFADNFGRGNRPSQDNKRSDGKRSDGKRGDSRKPRGKKPDHSDSRERNNTRSKNQRHRDDNRKGKKPHHKKQHNKHHTKGQKTPQKTKPKQQESLMGMVKSMFKAVFGKK